MATARRFKSLGCHVQHFLVSALFRKPDVRDFLMPGVQIRWHGPGAPADLDHPFGPPTHTVALWCHPDACSSLGKIVGGRSPKKSTPNPNPKTLNPNPKPQNATSSPTPNHFWVDMELRSILGSCPGITTGDGRRGGGGSLPLAESLDGLGFRV